MSLLSVQNVGKAFRTYSSEWKRFARWFGLKMKAVEEKWVLRNINFEIQPGESIGIIGQNGAGKSTLLKIITNTLRPSEGSVHVNGRVAAILELGMGFNPELSGRQNVSHAAGLMGFSAEQIQRAMPDIEAFAEIGEYFDEPVRTYSSGMQVRVAFAVATAFRPEILIIDEALSVGDAYFQAKCFARIKEFQKQGTSLILVTHSTEDIVKHCDRAIYLKNGQLIANDTPRIISNLYLDDLFGKSESVSNNENGSEQEANILGIMNDTNDIFHTRPGYRKDEHRWGNGGARIIDFLVRNETQDFPPVIKSNTKTEFYFKVVYDHNFNDITAGFLIKTHDGVFLYGTNSFLAGKGRQPVSVEKGEVTLFKFELPMDLNSGHYLISFGVSTGPQEMLEPLDRRYDSVLLTVERTMGFWGITDLKAEFGVIR